MRYIVGNSQIVGKRDNQEDYFASVNIHNGMLCIVADGMGGYEGGEVASKVVVKFFLEYCKKYLKEDNIETILLEATHFANKKLELEKENNPTLEEMGSTLIATYITNERLYWVSVGDSLLIKYNKQLSRLNADHSIAGELQQKVDSGHMTQEEADNKPNRNALTSALTGYEIPHIDCSSILLNEEDRFLLASDGILTIEDKLIEKVFKTVDDIQGICDELINLVQKRNLNNQDNTTIVIVAKQSMRVVDTKAKSEQVKLATPRVGFLFGIIIFLLMIIIAILYSDKIEILYHEILDTNTTQVQQPDTNKSQLNKV